MLVRVDSFLAWNVIGTNPSSKSTPSVLVCLLTPRSCLQNIMKNFSIGWFFGCFRQPQKSLQYSRIGLIKYVNICRVLDKSSLRWIPSAFFILAYAFSARIRRSSNPVLISPDGVTMNPRYLYSLTHVRRMFLYVNLWFLRSRPVLLKTMQ